MPRALLKSDSSTYVFLWILQNLQEQLLRKTYANRCFFIILFIYLFFFFFDSVNTFDVLRF